MATIEPVCLPEQIMPKLPAGSTQGIVFVMIRGLAAGGADIVMHGLVQEQELKDKTAALAKDFDVRVGHSSANVRKPQEIRHAGCTRTTIPMCHMNGRRICNGGHMYAA